MPQCAIRDLSVRYEDVGSGEPLLCVAGLGAGLEAWSLVRDQLADRFRVIAFDNRGMGKTTGTDRDFNLDDMVSDTVALMDVLGLTSVHIAGHSMGGAIAQCLAFRHPERVKKLVLCNSFARGREAALMAFRTNIELMRAGVPVHLVFKVIMPWLYSAAVLKNKEQVDFMVEQTRIQPPQQSLADFERQVGVIAAFDSRPYLNRIAAPTLVLAGDDDLLTPAADSRFMADHIPGARLETLPTAHLGLVEAPADYAQCMAAFLVH